MPIGLVISKIGKSTYWVCGNCVQWSNMLEKQETVCCSLSTTEAEYMAVGEVTKEVLWIKNMISELHLERPLPVTIHEDNNGMSES